MEWGPIFQTALGAGIALGAQDLVRRHQTKEASRAETRRAYRLILETLQNAVAHKPQFGSEAYIEAMAKFSEVITVMFLLGSQEVYDSLIRLGTDMDRLSKDGTLEKDPKKAWTDLMKKHRGSLVNAMRKDLGLKPLQLSQ